MAVLSPDFLRGSWALRRAINGDPDAFVGTATFTPEVDGVVWREHGQLRLGDYRGAARRTYLLRGNPPVVHFDDGRVFHALREGPLEHLCGLDTYRGVWTVRGPDRFALTWTVTGPGRADVIASEYVRAQAITAAASSAARSCARARLIRERTVPTDTHIASATCS